jgi:hypothetical protein
LRRFDDTLLKQEVEELTELLTHEEILADLRALLRKYGLEPEELLLAGFIENADGFEGGVVVTRKGEAYEFERHIGQQDDFARWEKVIDVNGLLNSYPAVLVALRMVQ